MSEPECYLLYPFPHDPPVERVTYTGDMYQVYDTAGAAIAFGDDARARPATSLPGVVMLRAQWFSEGPPANLARWGVYSEPQRLKMLVGAIGIGGLRRWLRDATMGQPEPSTTPAPWAQEYSSAFSMVDNPAVPPGAVYMLDANTYASIEKAMALLKAKTNEAIYKSISPLRVPLGTTIGSLMIPGSDLTIEPSQQKQEQVQVKVSQGKLDLEDDATPAPKRPAVIARAAALEIYDDEDE